jgi:hypothetical protein
MDISSKETIEAVDHEDVGLTEGDVDQEDPDQGDVEQEDIDHEDVVDQEDD